MNINNDVRLEVEALGFFTVEQFSKHYSLIDKNTHTLKEKKTKNILTKLRNSGATGITFLVQAGWKSEDNINWSHYNPEDVISPFQFIDGKYDVTKLYIPWFTALKKLSDICKEIGLTIRLLMFDECQITANRLQGAQWPFCATNHNGFYHFTDRFFGLWKSEPVIKIDENGNEVKDQNGNSIYVDGEPLYLDMLMSLFKNEEHFEFGINEPLAFGASEWWDNLYALFRNHNIAPSRKSWNYNQTARKTEWKATIVEVNESIYKNYGEEIPSEIPPFKGGKWMAWFEYHGAWEGWDENFDCKFNPIPLMKTRDDLGKIDICPSCGKIVLKGLHHPNYKFGDAIAQMLIWFFGDSATARAAKQRIRLSDDGCSGKYRDTAYYFVQFINYFFSNHRWKRPGGLDGELSNRVDIAFGFCWDSPFLDYPDGRNIFDELKKIAEALSKQEGVHMPWLGNTPIYKPEPDPIPIIPPEPTPNPEPIKHDLSAWYWINMKSKGLGIKEWWRALTGKGPRWCKEHHCPEDKCKEK